MDDSVKTAIFFAVVFFVILFFAIRAQKKINKETRDRQGQQGNRIESINEKICQLGEEILGTDLEDWVWACPSELLDRIHTVVSEKCKKAQADFIQANQIKQTCDSSSDWGLCGVSDDKFFYNLDAKNTMAALAEENNYAKTYDALLEIVESEKGSIWDYGDIIERRIATVNLGIESYRDAYKSIDLLYNCIALKDIQYFKVEGNVQYISDVSGGGVNLQGALTGAVLAGGAAAVIGSQVGTETRTEIVEMDNRKITIVYKKDNTIRSEEIRSYEPEKTIKALRNLIPQKEETAIIVNEKANIQSSPVAQFSSADEIKKFKELLDMGAITQEEFDAKKKQLLDL